jgi:hypothetical protein
MTWTNERHYDFFSPGCRQFVALRTDDRKHSSMIILFILVASIIKNITTGAINADP